jgi:hypothetical protein
MRISTLRLRGITEAFPNEVYKGTLSAERQERLLTKLAEVEKAILSNYGS